MWPNQAKQKLNDTLQKFKHFNKSSSLQSSLNDSNSGSENEKDHQNKLPCGILIIVIDSRGTPITVVGDTEQTDFMKVRVLASLVSKLLDTQNNTGKIIKEQYINFRSAQKRKLDEESRRVKTNPGANSFPIAPSQSAYSASPQTHQGEGDDLRESHSELDQTQRINLLPEWTKAVPELIEQSATTEIIQEFSSKILVIKNFYPANVAEMHLKQSSNNNRRRDYGDNGNQGYGNQNYGTQGYGQLNPSYGGAQGGYGNHRGDIPAKGKKYNERLPQISLAVIADNDKYEIGLVRMVASKAVSQLRPLIH